MVGNDAQRTLVHSLPTHSYQVREAVRVAVLFHTDSLGALSLSFTTVCLSVAFILIQFPFSDETQVRLLSAKS